MKRKDQQTRLFSQAAILALAEIKAATQSFDRGEMNVFEAFENIIVAVEAYQAAAQTCREAA